MSQWCYPIISSSVVPFSHVESFPALGSFPMTQLFTSGGQSMGASASASVLNIQDWFPLGWTGWISWQRVSKGLFKSVLQHHSSKASVLWCSAFCMVQLSLPYMTTGKTIALTRWTFVGKLMSLLFNILSKLKWSEVKSLNRVRLFATPWTVAYQASLSMRFSRQ